MTFRLHLLLYLLFLFFLFSHNVYSSNLKIDGLSKLNFDDLQSLTDINLNKESLTLVATREVPIKKDILGKIALDCLPNIYQIFIKPKSKDFNHQEFETKLLQARKFIEEIFMDDETLYICSMSSKTIVYKGLMLPKAITDFYLDLNQKDFRASTCVFHQRFSTNTSPRWHLAQPFRLLAHNGEINAIRGNRNWVKARSSKFSTPLIPKIQKFKQLVNESG